MGFSISTALQGANPFDPYGITQKSGSVAICVVALSTIVAVAGVLGFLTCMGISLGPLNALGVLTPGGAAGLFGVGAIAGILTLFWVTLKVVVLHRTKKKLANYLCRVLNREIQNATDGPIQTHVELLEAFKTLPNDFFEDKSHNRAKQMFSNAMGALLGSEVDFCSPPEVDLKDLEDGEDLENDLIDFSGMTSGVQFDIEAAGKDEENLHLFQTASQFNASEATSRFTPPVGRAMQVSSRDETQGPAVQRTNPMAFELVNAFLSNLGFNMLHASMPSAGTPFDPEAAVRAGYLCPTNDNLRSLTEEFKQNFTKTEYVCYSSQPEGATTAVYIFLQAAPAISAAFYLTINSDELQEAISYANHLALFQKGIDLAQVKQKPVVIHLTSVGCGAFNNNLKNIRRGCNKALSALKDEIKQNQVSIVNPTYTHLT